MRGLLASFNRKSQVVDDINNQQNNFKKQTGWGGRYRRPETSMYAAVDSEVVSKVHRFDPLVVKATDSVDEVLPESSFHSKLKGVSIPTDSIVSTTAASPYFSPTAEHIGIAWADAAAIRKCVAADNFDSTRFCWQGFFGEAEHFLVFKVAVLPRTAHQHQYSGVSVVVVGVQVALVDVVDGGCWGACFSESSYTGL